MTSRNSGDAALRQTLEQAGDRVLGGKDLDVGLLAERLLDPGCLDDAHRVLRFIAFATRHRRPLAELGPACDVVVERLLHREARFTAGADDVDEQLARWEYLGGRRRHFLETVRRYAALEHPLSQLRATNLRTLCGLAEEAHYPPRFETNQIAAAALIPGIRSDDPDLALITTIAAGTDDERWCAVVDLRNERLGPGVPAGEVIRGVGPVDLGREPHCPSCQLPAVQLWWSRTVERDAHPTLVHWLLFCRDCRFPVAEMSQGHWSTRCCEGTYPEHLRMPRLKRP